MLNCVKLRAALTLALAISTVACDEPTRSNSTAEAARAANPVALGKTGHGKVVDLTLTSVTTPRRLGTPGIGPRTQDGETFVVVRYKVKNTGTEPLSSSDRPSLTLIDGDGESYAEDSQAGLLAAALNDDLQDSSGDLNPNVSARDTAVWKVDKSSFDRSTWRVRASLGGLSASFDKAARWPLPPLEEPTLVFALK